ncbi:MULTISPECIES: hypothetical protein [Streptomyces]|uniref:hypothetical protein n=1 Tax=Streptomyces TaxID=1883 RepID=UPI0037D882B2
MQSVDLAATLTTGESLKTWVLLVVGNIFIAFLAIRAVGHFIKKEWGEMVSLLVAAVFVGGIIWAPTVVKDMLLGIWNKVAGTA